jgi:hypothetical protein
MCSHRTFDDFCEIRNFSGKSIGSFSEANKAFGGMGFNPSQRDAAVTPVRAGTKGHCWKTSRDTLYFI